MNSVDMFKAVGKIPADMVDAAELPADVLEAVDYGVSEKQKKREKRRNITSSPWFAAAVAMIVALGVTSGIVIAGRAGVPGTVDPVQPAACIIETDRFIFEYRLEGYNPFHAGETVSVVAIVTNKGKSFTLEGSSSDMHPHVTLHSQTGVYPSDRTSTDDYNIKKFDRGQAAAYGETIRLPEDAFAGLYDLEISFAGERVFFPNAVQVTNYVGDSAYTFKFYYTTENVPRMYLGNMSSNILYAGFQAYTFDVRVDEFFGGPYTYIGPESGLAPTAYLQCGDVVIIPQEIGYERRDSDVSTIVSPGSPLEREVTEEIGPDWVGRSRSYRFDTVNAQSGWYDLVIEYNGTSVVFPNVYHLIEDKDLGPFEIKYTLENGTEYKHGDVVYVSPSMKNLGIPFTVTGNMCPFSPAMTILKDGKVIDTVSINIDVPGTDDVGAGEEFFLLSKYYNFTIRDEWPDGSYDIEFSYKGTTVTYPGAFTVVSD